MRLLRVQGGIRTHEFSTQFELQFCMYICCMCLILDTVFHYLLQPLAYLHPMPPIGLEPITYGLTCFIERIAVCVFAQDTLVDFYVALPVELQWHNIKFYFHFYERIADKGFEPLSHTPRVRTPTMLICLHSLLQSANV